MNNIEKEKLERERNNRRRGPGGPGAMMQAEKAKDFNGTVKKILKSLDGYKKGILIAFIFSIASTIFSIIGPKILGNATQEIFTGIVSKLQNIGGIDFTKLHNILITCLVLYVISAICTYFESIIMANITQKYTYKLRERLNDKIHKLPFKYFDSKQRGEVLSIVTNDVDTLQMSFNQALTQLITSITTIVGVLVMMLSINVYMTLIAVLIVPLSALFTIGIIGKSQKYFKATQDNVAALNGTVEEILSGHQVVKVFNAEEKEMNTFLKNNKALAEAGWKSQFLSGLMHPIMMFLGNLGYVGVAIFGGYFAIQGKITVGNIQSFISYSKNFTRPITSIAQVLNQIQGMVAAAERIFAFLEEDEEVFGTSKLNVKDVVGNVEFKNVKFSYDKVHPIIHDFSAKINAGSKIAIVGPTGAGKTTIVKLLMHFYDIDSGSILIDGHDINEYNVHDLRRAFAMVLQDTWLYSGTILENLRYGKLNATNEEVYEAARIANVDKFIRSLPKGYNMEIDEEMTNISQGQKQLLTIARAILHDSKILILDEATSSVDTRTEELIQEAMDKLTKDKTSFIIAHRLSTIKNADLILVMDEGDIVETGTHDELLKKNGFYAKIYNSQFEK